MSSRKVRVRFAPSPTGPLHIGGVRTALYNYLFAKKNGGIFILRIEDTDQSRFVEGAEKYIRASLEWAGIPYDEGPGVEGPFGPYRQSERKSNYRQFAQDLVDKGLAYYAFDTSEELEAMRERLKKAKVAAPKYDLNTREYMKNSLSLPQDEVQQRLDSGEPYVIRIKMPRKETVKFKDLIRGWISVDTKELDDKVLFKSDGMPTYHLANVVDDHAMEISHVIRGEEWLPSAPLHVLLYRYLGWEDQMPEFAHLPLILKPDGKGKLSKRDGEKGGFPVFPLHWESPETGETLSGYREAGYLPEAFVNILALLGWNSKTDQEVFTLDELTQHFSIENIGKAGAKFDPTKAKWFNQQHLRLMSNEALVPHFQKLLQEHQIEAGDEAYLAQLAALLKEKASFISDFWEMGHFFFVEPQSYDAKVIRKKWSPETAAFFEALSEAFGSLENFEAAEIEQAFKATAEKNGMGAGKFMQIFRVAISGLSFGPAIFEMTALLGREKVVARLKKAPENFEG